MQTTKEREVIARYEADKLRRDVVPLHASQFMEALAAQLPLDAIIFDEALTTSPDLVHYHAANNTRALFSDAWGIVGCRPTWSDWYQACPARQNCDRV